MITNTFEASNNQSIDQFSNIKKRGHSSFLGDIQYSMNLPNNIIRPSVGCLNPRKISGCTSSSHKRTKKHKYVQPLWVFFIHLLIASVISLQNIYLIYGKNDGIGKFALVAFLVIAIVISIINSLYVVDFKTLLKMYFLMDNILLAEITADIGLIGTYLIASGGKWEQYVLMFGIPISFFFFVGNFRVCVKYSNWNKWRIIPYKICLTAGAVCFFQIGAYFMTVNYSYSGGSNPALDSRVKDFILLYAFGTFDFFMQLFAKISDFDQTAELKYVYEFKQQRQLESVNNSQQKI